MTAAPYAPPSGWDHYTAAALARVPDDGRRDDARAVIDLCRRAGVSLFATYKRWRFWVGGRDGPNWLTYLRPGDWKSFRLSCEHELNAVLTSNGKTVTT